MKELIAWGPAGLMAGPVAAQTYKWVDQRGIANSS